MSGQTSGVGFRRNKSTSDIPVWQRDKALELVQGGLALDKTNFQRGMLLKAGTPVVYDESTRIAKVANVAIAQAAASNTDTAYRVQKGSTLNVGMNLTRTDGAASEAITSIDRSNPNFDVVNVGTTLGEAVTAGDLLFTSAAAGATAGDLPAYNGLLYEETVIDDLLQAVSVVIRGTVYARRIPTSSAIQALPGLKHIIFSQSF